MKKILAPTDFSDNAGNAINYAAQIAKLSKAELILFHAYQVPAIPSDVPFVMPIDEIEKDALNGLMKIKKKILAKYGEELKITCETKFGLPVDEINTIVKEKKIDLVVMGVRGAGFLSEKLIGSLTTSLIRKGKCPVLAINEKVKFRSIKKIVLAYDYQKIAYKTILEPLKDFVKLFKSHVYLLNVMPELEIASPTRKKVAGNQIEHALEEFSHSFKFLENNDIVDGINEFVDENNIDMIVMIPRKHSLLESVFQGSNTKRMAFHSHIPLLALHE